VFINSQDEFGNSLIEYSKTTATTNPLPLNDLTIAGVLR